MDAPKDNVVVEKQQQFEKTSFQVAQIQEVSSEKKWTISFDMIEFLNAWSMLAPSLISVVYGNQACLDHNYCKFLYYHAMVHLPFSFGFHLYHVFRPMRQYGISLKLRQLDNIFAHVAGTMISYGNSQSEIYTAFAAVANAYWIYTILQDGRKPRVDNMGYCILMYTAPMLYNGQWCLYALTLAGFALSIWVFARKVCAPVHHPLMHLLLAIPQYGMLMGLIATLQQSSDHCPFLF
mmetsp:Transcript_45485/g.71149  ORF Transcript_45485/g.71149 Transcript_45485/m.71149 type:complete len:236 (-) Transcript_45485:413-1120(-)